MRPEKRRAGFDYALRMRFLRNLDLDFVGCDAVPAAESDLAGGKCRGRRFEYWHQASGTAWVAREEGALHARAPQVLADFLVRVSQVRGSPLGVYGTMGLRTLGLERRPGDIMHPDLAVYVRPGRARLPSVGPAIQGEHDWPDVVLEVDNATDVRRNKLRRYADWGLPEVWVEVPDLQTPGRPWGLLPGFTIYRLGDGVYQRVLESVAFPGLRAWELHAVLNVPDLRSATLVARRVGERMGEAEGTQPEDDPLLGWLGGTRREEGRKEGLAQSRVRFAAEILRQRGIALAPGFPGSLAGTLASADESRIAAAAFSATDEADFGARLLEDSTG